MSDYVQTHSNVSEYTNGEPWIILSEIEKSIKSKVEAIGTPLGQWNIRINYGIKTGFNDAFIISSEKRDEILAACQSDEERRRTEEIIRPILRGRDIRRYGVEWAGLWIINTHNGIKGVKERINIEEYPAIKAHLDYFWTKISTRTDKGDTPYNLRNCAYLDDLSKPKIVWGNLNKSAAYAYVEGEIFINAPCTMIVPASYYLLAILNSKLADFYIRSLGVVRNGGFFEYKPMFISQLPVPILDDLDKYEERFSNMVNESKETDIDNLVYEIYGLSPDEADYLKSTI